VCGGSIGTSRAEGDGRPMSFRSHCRFMREAANPGRR
jgi:hypothetical protein